MRYARGTGGKTGPKPGKLDPGAPFVMRCTAAGGNPHVAGRRRRWKPKFPFYTLRRGGAGESWASSRAAFRNGDWEWDQLKIVAMPWV